MARVGLSGWNLIVSSSGEIAARLLGFLYLVVLARYLRPSGFGDFNSLLAYYALAASLGSFGLDHLTLRDLSREQGATPAVFSTLLTLRVTASAVAMLVLILIGLLLPDGDPAHFMILGSALIPAGVAAAYASGFKAREQFGDPSISTGISAGLLLGFALLGVVLQQSLTFFLAGVLAAELVRAFWLFARANQNGWGSLLPGVQWDVARGALRTSALYWVLAVLGTIYFRIDLIMLDLMVGAQPAGYYAGAFRIMELLAVPSTLIMAVLFPRFARRQALRSGAGKQLYLASVKLLLWGGLAVASIGVLVARPLITLVFSSAYLPATTPLLWLMLALVFMFVHAPNATVLFAGDRLAPVAALSVLTASFNVVGNVFLIPRYGPSGAAAATAFSEVLSLFVFTPLVCRRLQIPLRMYLGAAIRPILGSSDLDLLLGRDGRGS